MPEWTVQIADAKAAQQLEESLCQGPIIDDQGRRWLTEAEVARLGGLKIEVFSDEHPSPHFRVSFQGQTANYRISDCLQINGGLQKYFRNIREWHEEHKQELIAAWDQYRPTDCPVGNYREEG